MNDDEPTGYHAPTDIVGPHAETADEKAEREARQLKVLEPQAKPWEHVVTWGAAIGAPAVVIALFYFFTR